MPLSQKQINRLLDPELIRAQDMPHTVGRAAESAVKRGIFAAEDRAVQELAGLYRTLRQDLRNDGHTLAEQLGIEKLEMNRAGQQWRQTLSGRAVKRVRALVTPVAANALKHATTAWMGGYFGRAWMLDVMTTDTAPIVVRRHNRTDVARYLAGLVGIREDVYTDAIYDLIAKEAPDWLSLFANELGELEIKIKRAIWAGMEAGEGIPDIMARVEDVLGSYNKAGYTANFNRVQMITRTVVNQASNNGAIQVYREHRDIVSQYEWLTAKDERVCFPANTLVETASGNIPIQNVRPGMLVRTRKGFKRVIAASKRLYSGDMVKVQTEHGHVFSTADHPYWTLEQGWLEGRYLQRGHFLQSINNKPVKVLSVRNFRLGNTAHAPSALSKICILAGIPFGVAMPVRAVHFQSNTSSRDQEVHAVTANSGLLRKINLERVKCFAYSLFNRSFTGKAPIATKTTKAPIDNTRLYPKRFATVFAFNVYRRTTALLRTVAPIQISFSTENLAAAFTGDVFCGSGTACPTANRKPVSNGGLNRECVTTYRTNFGHHLGSTVSFITSTGTKLFSSFNTGLLHLVSFTTMLAHILLATLLKGMKALATTENMPFGLTGESFNRNATNRASLLYFHGCQLLTKILVLYHKLAGIAIAVYDIQVEDEPEFYANGVLVHNCPICRSLNGTRYDINDVYRPPAHPNCRCTIIPVISDTYLMPGDGYYTIPSIREWAEGLGLAWWLNDFFTGTSKDSDRWGDDAYTDFY